MVKSLSLESLANRWVGQKDLEEGSVRERAVCSFKVTAFNAATAALIGSVALAIITAFHPASVAALFLSLISRVWTSEAKQSPSLARSSCRVEFLGCILWLKMPPVSSQAAPHSVPISAPSIATPAESPQNSDSSIPNAPSSSPGASVSAPPAPSKDSAPSVILPAESSQSARRPTSSNVPLVGLAHQALDPVGVSDSGGGVQPEPAQARGSEELIQRAEQPLSPFGIVEPSPRAAAPHPSGSLSAPAPRSAAPSNGEPLSPFLDGVVFSDSAQWPAISDERPPARAFRSLMGGLPVRASRRTNSWSQESKEPAK